MSGKVYLIGAGPGAPGLLTLRGRDALESADVVVYDALVNPQLLRYAKAGARRIDAGKRAGQHALEQDEINRLIVDCAREGQTVARLKGGDPFLFGRGAEEAEALEQAGIEYEAIPGVSSAFAAPAFMGVALTKRQVSASVHIFTAQGADPSMEREAWSRAANLGGTLVFLMGFSRLGEICAALVADGMNAATPVAIVQWGTTFRQKHVFATLHDAAARCASDGLGSPAIIVVGELAAAETRLRWMDWLPLFGKTVVFTREARRATPWLEAIEALGARTLDFPLIRHRVAAWTPQSGQALAALARFAWIVFPNSLAAGMFMDALDARNLDARALARCKVAAVGPDTAAALRVRGLIADFEPGRYTLEALAAELPLNPGDEVLFPGSTRVRAGFSEALLARGAKSVALPLYEVEADPEGLRDLVAALESNEADFLVLTQPGGVERLLAHVGAEKFRTLTASTHIVCIGEMSARVLETAGRPADQTLASPTLPALIEALKTRPG